MAAARKARGSITLVGTGTLASVLGRALRAAGFTIDEVVSRTLPQSQRRARALAKKLRARAATLADAALTANVIWLCHTDDAIVQTAIQLAQRSGWRGRTLFPSPPRPPPALLAPLNT